MKITSGQLEVPPTARCRSIARRAVGSIAIVTMATLGCQPPTMQTALPSDRAQPNDGVVQSAGQSAGQSDKPALSASATTPAGTARSDQPESQSWSVETMLKEAGLNKQQIAKNQTVLIAVASDDVRTNTLAFSLLPHISSQQRQQCRTLVATYKDDFDAMLAKRNDILDHIGGTEDTERELIAWRISMATLTRNIRRRMYTEILNDEQRQEQQKVYSQQKKSQLP